MRLEGCAAIVTGAASGLGAASAETLAQTGARVALIDVDAKQGEVIAEKIGGRFYRVDISDRKAVEAALADAAEAQGTARILVNCAGIVQAEKLVQHGKAHSAELFERHIRVNLFGTFHCMAVAAEGMARLDPLEGGERGVIVNTASIAAFEGQVGQVAYAASKAAVAGMTLPAARDLAALGIRVCAIAPGMFRTAMVDGLAAHVRDNLAANVPFPHRLGEPGEFAALVRHICENPMLNGETIRLDGALRMQAR
jgi:NAD(P)-dependent dehydrogenase (short-subunit alcohol dehydrogenase family)